MDDLVRQITAGRDERLAVTAAELVTAIYALKPDWDAALRWGQVTFARDDDFHHWLCGVGVTTKVVALTFHFGGLLDDPDDRLRAGSSRYLRRLKYVSTADVDAVVLAGFLDQADQALPRFIEERSR